MNSPLFELSSLRVFSCKGVSFGVTLRGLNASISILILFRYFSIVGDVVEGIRLLFFLKGVAQ